MRVLAWKAGQKGIDVGVSEPFTNFIGQTSTFPNITGHRDLGITECPGVAFYSKLNDLRAGVGRGRSAASSDIGCCRARAGCAPLEARSISATPLGSAWEREWPSPPRATPTATGSSTRRAGCSRSAMRRTSAAWPRRASRPGPPISPAVPAAPATGCSAVTAPCSRSATRSTSAVFPAWASRPQPASCARHPTGGGYWILGADGGIFSFGDAAFFGSVPGVGATTAAVDMTSTPSGRGYWVLGEDGGVFSFGDAYFHGSVPGLKINWARPARAIMAAFDGGGYHVMANDGGVFSFGNVPFHGSLAGSGRRPVGIAPSIQL